MTVPWVEKEFQEWIQHNPQQLGLGDLLWLGHADPFKRQVDTAFLSGGGAVVLVEVKNERTSREIIGQALEYAAGLEGSTLETIAIKFGWEILDLRTKFSDRFGHELTVSTERHVVLVAPQFDVACHAILPYLKHLARDRGVSFHLISASPTVVAFECTVEPEARLASTFRPSTCGLSSRGTLYVTLRGGAQPALWRVGKIEGAQVAMEKPEFRFVDELLRPTTPPENLDLAESGHWWRKVEDPQKEAVVLGLFRDQARGDKFQLVRIRSSKVERVKDKRAGELRTEWIEQTRPDEFDWNLLRGLTKQ